MQKADGFDKNIRVKQPAGSDLAAGCGLPAPTICWPEFVKGESEDEAVITHYTSRQQVDWHDHPFYEIVLVNQGSCVHYFRETSEVLIPGDCFLIPLHEKHAYAIPGETEIINCLFMKRTLDHIWADWQDCPEINLLFEPGGNWQILHLSPDRLAYIRMLLRQIEDHSESDETGLICRVRQHSFVLLLLELAGQYARLHHQRLGSVNSDIQLPDAGRTLIGRMLAYMQGNYQQPMTVKQLAEQVHLSEGHCRRLFVRYTGYSPIAFLNRLRLQYALQLLEKGDRSIAEVADRAGFTDAGYFARLFRRQMHGAPRDFLGRS
ncbi:MAG: AraC family transcriptional regulator [Clostridiaceae bacterium]|nr:AraC family transcriptional regulator [Clostridiaceae bacterium]